MQLEYENMCVHADVCASPCKGLEIQVVMRPNGCYMNAVAMQRHKGHMRHVHNAMQHAT